LLFAFDGQSIWSELIDRNEWGKSKCYRVSQTQSSAVNFFFKLKYVMHLVALEVRNSIEGSGYDGDMKRISHFLRLVSSDTP
jgi:hypothetical protein